MPYLRRSALGALIVVAGLTVAGCASIEPDVGSLPAGTELVATSGEAMRAVTSAHFTIEVTGSLVDVPIKNAEGDLDARGTARGSARISRSGALVTDDFVLLKGKFYVKGPTGGYQEVAPAAAGSLFDLTSILNPNHGMARVVIGVNDATTKDTETMGGIDCYRVTGAVAQSQVEALVPGIGSNVRATVWLAVSGAHLPVRAEFAVPGSDGGQGAKVDVSISNVNVPVTVTAPA
jgi:lipoprotein LprG